MASLSVNLNKVALLRNSRRTGVPDLRRFAELALSSGARGLTVHPRPDERHIRASDVPMLAAVMGARRPAMEFNIEGYPDERLLGLIRAVQPEQVTLVPDSPDAFTSEEGWHLGEEQAGVARDWIGRIKALGARVILFIDPDPGVIGRVRDSGADGVEIYTGGYAATFKDGAHGPVLKAIAAAGEAANAAGLLVNAGHDLNLLNIPPLVLALPFLAEASIGHELTAEALEHGWAATVAAYAKALA